jgi:polysaccharide export outer membrane protein
MTVQQVEAELTERLKIYIRKPEIAVSVTQLRSQPVSVFGAVGTPGIIQLEGRKTLIEVLSLAGGLAGDASSRVSIQRLREWGPIPLPSSTAIDPEAPYSTAEVNIGSLMDATHPEQNIQILPFDVILVAKAQVVYVMGEVRKPGGYALDDKDEISVLQLLARAEGLNPTAASKDAKIIRPVPGSNREELSIDLKDLLAGKTKDMMLQPEDILFVPDSYAKGAFRRTLDTIIQMSTGLIIYRR